ncbi:Ras GTPase-activating protein-binding protein 2 [Echinococcus granulosus]|uniref:Ras GTPase activating protein binding protein 1 n=1 Tax=Echinococcus granulosus TaxID=6210 RepID=A0A068WUG9_ECHGR|nr:Ras GTPase-activating protein-binding protein 2 [Echinococcus granulosus]CDS21303.1 Ras GTPase activating protein binding protein 1 [Echinococcus granulosus]
MVSNGDVNTEGPSLPKMDFMALSNLAEQFVLQYYSVMNKCPELLHRFYGEDSTLIYESPPICGQTEIHNAFSKLKLRETRVIILKIDALKACNNSALVQISGEISVSNGPFRRFMRSFTLFEKSPADFYVLSDILRYQDRVYIPARGESKVASGDTATEARRGTKPTSEKSVTKGSSNGAAQEQKRQAHEKRSEVPQTVEQEPEPRGAERPLSPRTPTPKPLVEPPPQKVVEKQVSAQVVQSQPAPSPPPPRESLPAAQLQPLTQQPISTAPMSWAQRASGNIGSAPASSVVTYRPQPQPAKPPPVEQPTTNTPASSTQKLGLPKQIRSGGRPHQTDTRRDSNGDRGDCVQAQLPQQQQFQHQQQPRGGFTQSGGAREGMRNNGGGAGRGNRGSGSVRGGGGGGNRTAANAASRR